MLSRLLLLRFGLPVLAVGLALAGQLSLPASLEGSAVSSLLQLLLLFAAIIVSAWCGGLGAGLIASGLSTLAALYFFLVPGSPLSGQTFAQSLLVVIFLLEGAAISAFVAAFRSAKRRLEVQQSALEEGDERTRLIFEGMPEAALYTLDAQGRVSGWNAGAAQLFGYSEQEIKSEPFARLYAPNEARDGVPDQALGEAKNNNRYQGESWRVRRDGSLFRARSVLIALKGDDGALRGYAEVTRDISEQKRAEASLRESEDRFRLLADTAPVMIWMTGPDKQYHYFNANWLSFTGRTLEQEQNDGWIAGIHPQEMRVYLAAFDRAFEQRQNFHLEFRLRRADGEYRWVSSHGAPRRTADGEFAGYIGTCADVTNEKQGAAEREKLLREIGDQQRKLEAVLRQMPAGVLIAEAPSERIVLANNQLDQIWRHSATTAKRYKNTFEYKGFHADNRPYQLADWPLFRSLRTGEIVNDEELDFERGDGTRGTMLVSSAPVRDAEGHIVAAVATFYDATARKVAEREKAQIHAGERMARKEAEAANRIKDEFLATLSHELRTPLTAILGWVKMLRTNTLDDANAALALETIQRSAQAQTALVDELLDVSRVVSGKLHLDVKLIDLAPLLEAAVAAGKPAADAKSINVQLMLEDNAGQVSGDPDRLHQIFWNLLSNAIKFTPKRGHVAVKLRRDGSNLEVSVSDTGIGIESEFLPHVFERFRQADSSSTRAHAGLGLGLAIVKHLVELHGGIVTAESRGPGQGADFRVTLPAVTATKSGTFARRRVDNASAPEKSASISGVRAPDQSSMLSGVRVLVVDDEVETLKLLTVVLRKYGATVTSVSSAPEAFKQLKMLKFDVLVSDVQMPGESGYELIGKVRALGDEQGGATPAAALTAYAGAEERVRALLSGFQIHVPKPVEPAELAAVVAALAGRSGQGQQF